MVDDTKGLEFYVGEMKGKFDGLKDHIDIRFDHVDEKLVACANNDKVHDERLDKLENGKWWNRAASTAGGIIGGALAVIGVKIFVK